MLNIVCNIYINSLYILSWEITPIFFKRFHECMNIVEATYICLLIGTSLALHTRNCYTGSDFIHHSFLCLKAKLSVDTTFLRLRMEKKADIYIYIYAVLIHTYIIGICRIIFLIVVSGWTQQSTFCKVFISIHMRDVNVKQKWLHIWIA